jgi:N-acetyl-gamma-glutamyl-phosphate reductase
VSEKAVNAHAEDFAAQPLHGEPAARVLVAAASGFAGALAADIAWRHPRIELTTVTARSKVGTRLDDMYPQYRVPLELEELDLDGLEGIDAAIVAYPHSLAAPVVAAMRRQGIRVVDISADFRLRDPSLYERWYGGEHGAPGLLPEAVYGLTELHREEIAGADLVANPGCYPTAAILALAPLAEAGLLTDVVVDAKSGISGAGRGAGEPVASAIQDENCAPYAIDGHRHEPEIAQELALLAGGGEGEPPLTFVPHFLPLFQGLLASCYVRLESDLSAGELRSLYEARYAAERFVELVEEPPEVRNVRKTNLCQVCVRSTGPGRVVAFAAIDNLWKGASSQAIQNLNLMLGLPEAEGLT